MIAIHTKFMKATSTKGAWIKAYTTDSITMKGLGFIGACPIDYSLDDVSRHFEAVKVLVANNDLQWDLSDMRYGDSADGKGYVFCFANSIVKG
jgi:hypothetical protein